MKNSFALFTLLSLAVGSLAQGNCGPTRGLKGQPCSGGGNACGTNHHNWVVSLVKGHGALSMSLTVYSRPAGMDIGYTPRPVVGLRVPAHATADLKYASKKANLPK